MNAAFKSLLLVALAAVGMSFCELALARNNGNVYWSIGVVAPGYPVGVGVGFSNVPLVYSQPVYWGPPAVVYAPLPLVYGPAYGPVYGPAPVYLAPGAVYLQPVPMYYGPRYWRHRH